LSKTVTTRTGALAKKEYCVPSQKRRNENNLKKHGKKGTSHGNEGERGTRVRGSPTLLTMTPGKDDLQKLSTLSLLRLQKTHRAKIKKRGKEPTDGNCKTRKKKKQEKRCFFVVVVS